MTITIYAAAATLWIAIVGLVLAFVKGGQPPCQCPLKMREYLQGRRCERHQETTEASL